MFGGGTGEAYASSSGEYEIAAQRLRGWYAAVESFSGTAEELYLLLDQFEAWAVVQPSPFRGYALSYINSVRRRVNAEEERNKTAGQKKRGTATEPGTIQGSEFIGLNKLPHDGFALPDTGGVIGKEYNTPRGPRRLKPHYFIAVRTELQSISSTIAKVNMSGARLLARVELRDALGRWYDNIEKKWEEKITKLKRLEKDPVLARIPINSDFRELGETCQDDEHGALDSTDRYGHWRGFAVDVQNNYWGSRCYPNLTEKEILEAAYAADLKRPLYNDKEGEYKYRNDKKDGEGNNLGEWWHFSPENHLLPKTESPEVP